MPSPSQLLRMEPLERRENPAGVGTPWADATALTISFAPDGTPLGAAKSELSKLMKGSGSEEVWQREILRAFQTWAAATDANVAVVADGGQAFGTSGEVQGDNRFGDIRVGAAALSADSLANAVPYSAGAGTWSGDLVFNKSKTFTVNSAGYDLYSVALHEAGHVFGLDHSADPASAMTEGYSGRKTGPTAADLSNLRAVYGKRPADRYEGATGNDTFATATALPADLYQVLYGDLTAAGDEDVFAFTVPAGAMEPTASLSTAGVSAVSAVLEVFDAAGNLVARSGPTDPLHPDDLSVKLPGGGRYFARVSSPASDVFAVGRYQLTLTLDKLKATGAAKPVDDRGTNDTIATALPLPAWGNGSGDRFRIDAKLDTRADVDVYRVQAAADGTADALQLAVRNLRGDKVAPEVRVFDEAGRRLTVQVLESSATKTTYQLLGVSRGATYFVEVRSPAAADATGDYRLTAVFGDPVSPGLTQLDSGAVSTLLPRASGAFTLDSARLVQLSLNVAGLSADGVVTLKVTNAVGKVVGEWAVNPLTGQVNASALLPAGTYRLSVTYTNKKLFGTLAPVRYWLFAGVSSDPIGPTAPGTSTLPTSPPPPPPPPTYIYTGLSLLPSIIPVGYAYKS